MKVDFPTPNFPKRRMFRHQLDVVEEVVEEAIEEVVEEEIFSLIGSRLIISSWLPNLTKLSP